ncbi:hypothetical protein RFI_28190 [Reticulomyxa filosa]|uniref:Protein-PII uridylyltransferase N-terminal domain-containing protein n=1 Tax=Reticulomyxa filosa TaxID=46433 RepID=X6M5D9_RETFI|nr:hypothetical protein RFI_28190 [Reticulomyxa filosa]|eukprot:ETO09198.1 hypothetical protein RFI_28190 [Reticulomyxa filosa]
MASQQIRILAQILPNSIAISFELYNNLWNKYLIQLCQLCANKNTKRMTRELCEILKMIWEFVLNRLPPSLCEYALLALRSLGRKEASPYSDMECACLIAEDTPEIRKYFANVSSMFEIVLIGMG